MKSARLVAAILITTLIGLLLTTAAGLVTVGRFNLISVAFIPLFVGLGVDFGIQFSVRYRAERLVHEDLRTALRGAATAIGGSLSLAAAAITLGFLAFLPTQYIGVSELGMIAGVGMIIALALNVTLLPALILLFRPRRQTEAVGSSRMAPVDHFLVERRKLVLWALRRFHGRQRRPAAVRALRLQPSAPAQSERRGDVDPERPHQGSEPDAEQHRRADPLPGRRRSAREAARQAAGGRTGR